MCQGPTLFRHDLISTGKRMGPSKIKDFKSSRVFSDVAELARVTDHAHVNCCNGSSTERSEKDCFVLNRSLSSNHLPNLFVPHTAELNGN